MAEHFTFSETFFCAAESGLPRSLSVEKNSVYTHNHIRWEDGVCYISCQGNKFFCITPELTHAQIDFSFRFHNACKTYGCAVYFRYDRMLRKGCCVELLKEEDGVFLSLCRIDREQKFLLDRIAMNCGALPEENELHVSAEGDRVSAVWNGKPFTFACAEPLPVCAGEVGVTFCGSIGEMALVNLRVQSDDPILTQIVQPQTTAQIPLRNGSNIPYRLTWSIIRRGSIPYLEYRLAGGPGERESYPGYPRKTGQYGVEQARMTRPYITLYSGSGKKICRGVIFPKRLTVTDPGLHWAEILRAYLDITDLPIEGSFPLPIGSDAHQIAFGYEEYCALGYCMQREKDVEFTFDLRSGNLLKEGKSPDAECLLISSPEDKAACRIIPDDAVDAELIRRRMADNHYFTEEEPLCLTARVQTKKSASFLRVCAELKDVFGDSISEMSAEKTEDIWCFTHSPMPVGVYRVLFTAFFGDNPLCSREIVLEVFDPTGERCAPLESGLPFLYSTPNEQRYLERDAFDPWNPFPSCDIEHYYAASCFAGDIAMKKRIWEVIGLFGRKWYVWNSDHRTLTVEEFRDHHEEILRHCDFCYYPLKHEWAVIRHDFIELMSYRKDRLMPYLCDFLSEHPEYDIGLTPDTKSLTKEQHRRLMFTCYQEWMQYANERIFADAARDNEWMRSINPSVKRACYGPFPIYAYPLTTYNSMRYIGFPTDERLSEIMFDGFSQLEDYPYSCCYNTYKGPFLLSHVLLHAPDMHIYPEQYTASDGGCIDGAVKDANPPLGKYDMPTYFNVTHAYEFVYNTAHLTKDGFRFWEKRGFMQRDFMPEFVDAFIRGWKHVLSHEPVSVPRSTAYLSEIPSCEDEVKVDGDSLNSMNRSDSGIAYMYETARTHGLPNGFTFRWDMLDRLTADMTDCIVLPSLIDVPDGALDALRKLHRQGVSLISVGRVDGLEDLFGVRYAPAESVICRLSTPDGKQEFIFPDEAHFLYESDDAEVILHAHDEDGSSYPVLLRKDRTLLLNAPAPELGHRTFPKLTQSYAPSISCLLREVTACEMHRLSRPAAVSDNCGITLFKDQNGNLMLLAIDYSPYENDGIHKEYQSVIRFNDLDVQRVQSVYGPAPSALRNESGKIDGLWLTLHQQECALIRLM